MSIRSYEEVPRGEMPGEEPLGPAAASCDVRGELPRGVPRGESRMIRCSASSSRRKTCHVAPRVVRWGGQRPGVVRVSCRGQGEGERVYLHKAIRCDGAAVAML